LTFAVTAAVGWQGCIFRADPVKSGLHTVWARQLLSEGDREGAIEECRRALRAWSHSRVANHLMGRLLIETGSPDRARRYFSRAACLPHDIHRLNAQEVKAAAESLLVLGKAHRATELLGETAGVHPRCAELKLLRAVAHFKAKEFTAAVKSLEEYQAVEGAEKPEREILWQIYARYLAGAVRNGASEQVLKRSQKAVELFPDSSPLHALMGRCLTDLGRDEEAAKVVEKALALDPYNSEAVRQARFFYVRQGQYVKALEIWQRSIPRSVVYSQRNKLLDILRSLGFLSKAAESLSPPDYMTHHDLAQCYRHLGWIDEAIEQCKHALRIKPDGLATVMELAQLLRHRDFVEAAREYLDDVYAGQLRAQETPDISAVVRALRRIARAKGIVLSDDSNGVYRIVFYGREIHAVNLEHSGLAKYFLEFGRYLHLSQIHGPFSFKLMNIVAWFEMSPGETSVCFAKDSSGERHRAKSKHAWALCDEDSITSFYGYTANRPVITGQASLSRKGYYVDMQPLRPAMVQVRAAADLLRGGEAGEAWSADRNALLKAALGDLNLPTEDEAAYDEVFQHLLAAEIDAVATHEEGHIIDMNRHLPIIAHIPSHFIEGVRARFSPRRIHNRIELYAEAFASVNAGHPHLVLLNNLYRLETESPSRYIYFLLYYLSLEDKQYSPYTALAKKMYGFLVGRLKTGPPGSGEIGEALAKLTPEEIAELNAEFCLRSHIRW